MQMIEKSRVSRVELKGHRAFYFFWGLAVWAAATVALRLAGQYLFDPANLLVTIIVFAATPPGQLGLGFILFRLKGLSPVEQYQAAVWLCLPGIFLDTVSMVFFANVFPNIAGSMQGVFGGWLLLAYGTILLAPLVLPAVTKE